MAGAYDRFLPPMSPDEVASLEFERSRSGYDRNQVRASLRAISRQMSEQVRRITDLENQLKSCQSSPVELTEFDLLERLGDTARAILGSARSLVADTAGRAGSIAESAVAAAESADSSQRADNLVERAKRRARHILEEAVEERDRLLAEIADLSDQRDQLIGELEDLEIQREQGLAEVGASPSTASSSGGLRAAPEDIGPEHVEPAGVSVATENISDWDVDALADWDSPEAGPLASYVGNSEEDLTPDSFEEIDGEELAEEALPDEDWSGSDEIEDEIEDADLVGSVAAGGAVLRPVAASDRRDTRPVVPGGAPIPERAGSEPSRRRPGRSELDLIFRRVRQVADGNGKASPGISTAVAPEAVLGPPDHSGENERLLQRRTEELGPIGVTAVRRLKRALQDHQNALLDWLRTQPQLPASPPATPEFSGPIFSQAIEEPTRAAVLAGFEFGPAETQPASGPAVDEVNRLVRDQAQNLSDRLSQWLDDRLGRTWKAASSGDLAELVEALSAPYREARGTQLGVWVMDSLISSFHRGMAIGRRGRAVRWIMDDGGNPCPDCEDNSLATDLGLGERFPTGQPYPPAHSGCRCLLVEILA
jgi:cell division septum initiation protein DivIVA